jgi:type I restriction enzyme S subunit
MEVREASAAYAVTATPQAPKGYKQTEVGVIPEDWEFDYIENLAHITTGSRNTQDRVDDGQYPFFVRSQTVEHINSYSFDGEAVLTAGDGVGTGKVFHYIKGKFDAHQRVYRISDFNERVNGYFFYLYFSSHFYDRIMQMTAKSSVDSVRREMIARMLIPLPATKAEQEAIAQALSDADALIESLERLLAKKRHLKQGAMQELLTGKKRLPGFSGEWAVKRLGELADIRSGGTPSTTQPQFWDGDIPWCTPTDITGLNGFKYLSDTSRKISPLGLKSSSAEMIPANSIVMRTMSAARSSRST